MPNPSPSDLVPVGAVAPIAADVTDPAVAKALNEEGWLPCLGQTVAQGDYTDLFAVIGHQFGGSGDQFRLPDLRGLFVRGAVPNGVPSVGTEQKYSTRAPRNTALATDQAGEHSHSVNYLPQGTCRSYYTAGHSVADGGNKDSVSSHDGDHSHTVTGGGDLETRPPNTGVDFIIKFAESTLP